MIKATETKLKGCFVIEPTIFKDDRGYFFESYNHRDFCEAIGKEINFVQDNQDAFPPELTGNVRPGAYKDAFGPSISIVQPIYNGGILRSQLNFAQALGLLAKLFHDRTVPEER